MSKQPIGFFDSGVGGTSIWKEVIHLLPHENSIYLSDSSNAPYGEKSADDILKLSVKNTKKLLKLNCKLIVVACNTATTNAIDYLRSNFEVPFIGIEPAIKPAALSSKSKAIGILATKGTLSSALFARTSSLYASDLNVIEVIGKGLVERIENGLINTPETRELLQSYLEPMISAKIDYLVLGCSHYPYLIPILREMLPDGVQIIDSGRAVAVQTQKILELNSLISISEERGNHKLYTNASVEILTNIIKDVEINKKVEFLDF
ncbi:MULTISPECIES: glutamate racemase [unclassified Leeuwenhoekiella]|uniref:glutamate racemase n=1 Tax=unclassified Leeuwenhoekiella TaxID=2615029 RepID=UPI000C459CFE|nr:MULTISPECIES: glutamate racemase [unclassified Leeuwenhoekiella]MAW96390.1 glutamate racemase [Leeuwenhoekiella sp.]MBA81277.1 glutamate racemase [Leeuwenhoekiella sp.]|tara:strand:+ start:40405 stop:41193 length:789 start_codon:yes stop_codon:yes gene_type:complete